MFESFHFSLLIPFGQQLSLLLLQRLLIISRMAPVQCGAAKILDFRGAILDGQGVAITSNKYSLCEAGTVLVVTISSFATRT